MKHPITHCLMFTVALLVGGKAWAQLTLGPEWLLLSPASAAVDRLGTSLALDGDTLAVGAAMRAPLFSTGPGRVEVFRGSGPGWALEGTLIPPGGMDGDEFGASVALDGDTIVVGAPYADSQGPTSGAVYVYVRGGLGWELEQQLFPAGTASGYQVGSAVDLEGDRLVVGADGGVGRVHVFERAAGVWTEVQRLAPSVLSDPDHFGRDVSLDGDRLVATAPQHDGGGHDAGAVFVFDRRAGVWHESDRLTGAPDSRLGTGVSLDGNLLVALGFVGPPGGGKAWHFDGTHWIPEPAFQTSGGWYMQCLEIHGETLVVAGQDAHAVVFTRSADQWSESIVLTGLDGIGGFFHDYAALDGDQLVLGAPEAVASPARSGAVHVIHLSGRDVEVTCDSEPGSTGRRANLGVAGGLSVGGNDLALHVLDATPGSIALMTCGQGAAHYPFANGTLCIDPLAGMHRVGAVALGAAGEALLPVDLATMPSTVGIQAGESWIFQAWYRDVAAGGAGFNLSSAVRLGFTP